MRNILPKSGTLLRDPLYIHMSTHTHTHRFNLAPSNGEGPKSNFFYFHGAAASSVPGYPRYGGLAITLRHITVVRTSLDEWSAGNGDLYWLHTTLAGDRQISKLPVRVGPSVTASKILQTHVPGCAGTQVDTCVLWTVNMRRSEVRKRGKIRLNQSIMYGDLRQRTQRIYSVSLLS